MGNANMIKECTEFVIFTTLVSLHGMNFVIKQSSNMSLKVLKFLKNFRLMFEQINPRKPSPQPYKKQALMEP
jgi:hypothetical protein